MEKIMEKISNYHIFNYLFPGIIFTILSDYIIGTKIYNSDITYMFFMSYFIGLIISRFSSLFIEKALNKLFNNNNESYYDYIRASKNDQKIEILVQDRNMYRSVLGMIFLLLMTKIGYYIIERLKISLDLIFAVGMILLLILFLLSYLKQNKYIIERIKFNKNN